jgi:hypothetical protein
MILSGQSSEEAIAAAKRALDNHKQFWFGSVKVESEFYDLGIMTKEERLMAVDIALLEITARDRLGPEPPGNVSHPSSPFPTQPLYAFCWQSQEYGKLMYFKFGVGGSRRRPQLAVYSFHESKPRP